MLSYYTVKFRGISCFPHCLFILFVIMTCNDSLGIAFVWGPKSSQVVPTTMHHMMGYPDKAVRLCMHSEVHLRDPLTEN